MSGPKKKSSGSGAAPEGGAETQQLGARDPSDCETCTCVSGLWPGMEPGDAP